MKINGTLVNYYIHCPRQCYLHAHRINLENNSESVKVGKALHEAKYKNDENAEIAIDNIRLDKLTKDYLTETKKSDADVDASQWQLIVYLYKLKQKGLIRKGKLEFIEKNNAKKTVIIELDDNLERKLLRILTEIENLINEGKVPEVIDKKHCKKCAYYEYCYI